MAESSGVNPAVRRRFKVRSIGGQELELLHEREQELYLAAQGKYLSENAFTAASDKRGLDRLILFEVQVFRWQSQMASGQDYDGVELDAADEIGLRRAIKDTEAMISQLQNDLGLTKAQRDKASNSESVAAYVENLKQRAKEHGVRRDKQIGRSIELINELFAIVGSFQRSNENERSKLGFDSADDIMEWIWEVMRPRFQEVDDAYRQNQKMWVRSL